MIITGPPTHCAGCQTSNGRWRLSSSVVCNAAGGPPGAWAVGRPTLHGGPVLLRPVRATPCFYVIFIHSYWRLSHGHLQQLSTLYCTFCCILPNLLHDISAVWFGIKWDVLGLLNTVDHCYTCDALVMAAEGKAIIFYCRFLKFVSIDERPAMVSQPNLASRSGVVSIYKCPPPQKKIVASPKFRAHKTSHFFRDFCTRHRIFLERNVASTNKNAIVNLWCVP